MPKKTDQIPSEHIERLTKALGGDGAAVLLKFNSPIKGATAIGVDVSFAPVEGNEDLNAVAHEFTTMLDQLLPEMVRSIYRHLVETDVIDISGRECSCPDCAKKRTVANEPGTGTGASTIH